MCTLPINWKAHVEEDEDENCEADKGTDGGTGERHARKGHAGAVVAAHREQEAERAAHAAAEQTRPECHPSEH